MIFEFYKADRSLSQLLDWSDDEVELYQTMSGTTSAHPRSKDASDSLSQTVG